MNNGLVFQKVSVIFQPCEFFYTTTMAGRLCITIQGEGPTITFNKMTQRRVRGRTLPGDAMVEIREAGRVVVAPRSLQDYHFHKRGTINRFKIHTRTYTVLLVVEGKCLVNTLIEKKKVCDECHASDSDSWTVPEKGKLYCFDCMAKRCGMD